jgi:hypothetical protein
MTFLGELIPKYGYDPDNNILDPWPGENAPYEKQVKYWCEAAYEEAILDNRQSEDIKEMSKAIDYLTGNQWPTQRPQYKSKPVNNRIWRLFWEVVATLTDIRPLFDIKSLQKPYKGQEEILNKCTRSWWMGADADLTLAQILVYAMFCTGYGKLEWNPRLRNGEGDFNLIPLGPNQVLCLKARNQMDSAQVVIYAVPQPLSWFRQKYPTRGYAVKPDPQFSRYAIPQSAPPHIPSMLFDMMSPAMRRVVGQSPAVQDSMFPMAMYREFWFEDYQFNQSNKNVYVGDPRSNWGYWVKPSQRLYPRGRLICMGGTEVMYDGPNPYWHGQPPFAVMRMNVVPWQFQGLSELKPLMPLQDIINNILAGTMDMVKKALNPPFIAPTKAFSEAVFNSMDWGMPGAKAQYNANVPHAPQWQQPPPFPSWILNVATLVAREMDASSGIATVAEAVRKKQVPAADTLEQMKQSQQTPLRLKGRNIEVFLRRMGQQNIANIFQFYTAERRMFMLGSDGLTNQDFDYDPKTMVPGGSRPEDHVRNFVFNITPGTLLSINQVEKSMLLMKLRGMKDISRKTLYQQLDMGIDAETEQTNLAEENAELIKQAIAAKLITMQVAGGAPGGPGAPAGPLPGGPPQ